MKGAGECFVSVAHAQTWTLIAAYEFKMMYFPRAWTSTGQAARLSLMMGLNRVDGVGLDVKQCLPPPQDWTEREERRRTFWMAYCCDRYASIGTGWPVCIDERDVSSLDAFLFKSRSVLTQNHRSKLIFPQLRRLMKTAFLKKPRL